MMNGAISILFIDRHIDYRDYMSVITTSLEKNGLKEFNFLPLPTTSILAAKQKIEKSAGIILLGGDTDQYVKHIVETSLKEVIHHRFHLGVPIAGFSAGALISLDPCIISPKDHAERIYQERHGLGLVSNIQIAVHFSEWDDQEHLQEIAKRFPNKHNYGIDEKTGIYIKDGQLEMKEGKGVYQLKDGRLTEYF